MLAALRRELPGRATWSHPEGGYFLWVDFADDVEAGELLGRATEAGVDIRPRLGLLRRASGGGELRAARVLVRAPGADHRRRARSSPALI